MSGETALNTRPNFAARVAFVSGKMASKSTFHDMIRKSVDETRSINVPARTNWAVEQIRSAEASMQYRMGICGIEIEAGIET